MATTATITLKINDEYINNKEVAYLYPYFINILAYNIAKNTPIEYWVKDKSNDHVSFTIKSYTNEDKKKTHKEVIKEKTNIISQHINTLNAKQFSTQELWLLRTLMLKMKSHNMDFDKILQLIVKDGDETILNKQLRFIIDGLQLVEYKIIRLQDGSTIRQLIDPYVKWYGIFCDYSKTFDEYNYMYNGLHVYEHYIANCWDGMSDNNVITFNGGTYSNGLMYIYSVVSDIETLKERFIRYITFHIKSSDTSFIKQSSILERETIRTISEGYKLRNLTRLARTSQQGFGLNYPVDVFAYWSSQPMNILLITNKELNINVNHLNEFYKRYHKHVDKPQQQHFNYFPREIYHMMTIENKHLYKKSTDKIVKKIFNGKFTFKATSVGCKHNPKCVDYVVIDRGINSYDPGCAVPLINVSNEEKYELSKELPETSGALISISNLKDPENILDKTESGEFDSYAEYVGGLSLASNIPIVGVKLKDGKTSQKL